MIVVIAIDRYLYGNIHLRLLHTVFPLLTAGQIAANTGLFTRCTHLLF